MNDCVNTLRISLLDSEIRSPWCPLGLDGSWGNRALGRAAAAMPREGRGLWVHEQCALLAAKGSESMDGAQQPLCHPLGLSMDPDVFLLMLAVGGGLVSQAPSRGWGLPPLPVVPGPRERLNVLLHNPGFMETAQTQLILASLALSNPGFWKSLGLQLK